jgi:hypothetical protein
MKEKIKVDPNKVIKVNPKMVKVINGIMIELSKKYDAKSCRFKIPPVEDLTINEAKYIMSIATELIELLNPKK